MIFCHYTGSHSFRIITGSNRAPSVIEKSGASSHQGLNLRGDELDLVGMTFPSLIYPPQYIHIHTLLPLNTVSKDFFLHPEIPSCVWEKTQSKDSIFVLCQTSRVPISRGIKWIHLRIEEHIRNFDLFFFSFEGKSNKLHTKEFWPFISSFSQEIWKYP